MKRKHLVSVLIILAITGCGLPAVKLSPFQENQIRTAVYKAVPGSSKIRIAAYKMSENKISLEISVHLLNDILPSSTNPYVQGRYGSHGSLTNLAMERCAQIMRNILNQKAGLEAGRILVNVNHGVRVTTVYQGSYRNGSTSDVAMNLLTVRLDVGKLPAGKSSISNIRQRWEIRRNIIPSLSFMPG